jgi:hypothetical protein
MFELMLNVRGASMLPDEVDVLKKLLSRYLNT